MARRKFLFMLMILSAACVQALAQHGSPTATPSAVGSPGDLGSLPTVAADYRSDDRSLPDLARVGVDVTRQRPLLLKEAIELALVNNTDIEVSRKTAAMAEYDLRYSRAFFQTRLTGYSTTD